VVNNASDAKLPALTARNANTKLSAQSTTSNINPTNPPQANPERKELCNCVPTPEAT
jgi:hypothetical protein